MSLLETISREEFHARKKRRIEERKEAAKTAQPSTPKQKPTASVPACHEVQGYMPGRREFEVEHANDAEEAVQHMQFDPGDGLNPRTSELDPEMELKLTVMDIYNSRLTSRVERKKVMLEHNLLEYKKNVALEKKRTKEERDLINKTKPFARMMSHVDYEEMCQGLLHEHNLRQAIAQLQEWRQMSLTDLKSGERYEAEKQQRAQRAQPANPLDRLASSRASKATPPVEAPSAAAVLTAPELPPRFQRHGSQVPPPTTTITTNGSPAVVRSSQDSGLTSTTATANNNGGGGGGAHSSGTPTPPQPTHKSRMVMQPLPNIQPLKFDAETPTDWHLLTRDEQQLCAALRLYPKPYLVLKEQLMKEAMKQGGCLKKKVVKEICKVCCGFPLLFN